MRRAGVGRDLVDDHHAKGTTAQVRALKSAGHQHVEIARAAGSRQAWEISATCVTRSEKKGRHRRRSDRHQFAQAVARGPNDQRADSDAQDAAEKTVRSAPPLDPNIGEGGAT